MRTAFINGRILIGSKIVDNYCVIVEGGKITSVIPQAILPAKIDFHDLDGLLLAPGFIDIQVNGGGGHLFNDAPTVETIAQIGKAHRQYGTAGFLPTLISDDLEIVAQAIRAVEEAIAQGVPGVLGIHIEGPFLNKAKKGIHNQDVFRTLSDEDIPLLTSLKTGKTLITLAPECTDPKLIKKLVGAGAIVSAGHTNASYAETRIGIENGVTCFTHLFNAMSPFTSREPGVVGAALEDQDTWCGIIVDGKHVSSPSLKIALKCKPLSKYILVTDAMPTVGSPDNSFILQGQKITVKDGVCVSADGTLAGCHLNMAQAVRNTISMLDVPTENALAMASQNPAVFLGVSNIYGKIAPGFAASFVALDEDFKAVNTWINGQLS